MSTIDAFQPQPVTLTGDTLSPQYSVLGFGALGFSVAGTFTSGTMTVQGTIDGNTWSTLVPRKNGAALASNQITATGNYLVNVVAYTEVKIVPSSFVGQVTITSNITTPFFFEGVYGMVTDVSADLPLLSSGGSSPTISLSGLSTYGTALQVPRMNAGATALEWSTPTTGDVTGVTGTLPIVVTSGTGPVPDVTLKGLTSIGTNGQVPMSDGTSWGYATPVGTGSLTLQASSTATMTLTGVDSVVTATAHFVRTGSVVTAEIPTLVGTSNTTACTITGLAVALRPARDQFVNVYSALNADVEYSGRLAIRTTGVIDVLWVSVAGGGGISASGTFTASGVKGFGHTTITYCLD